MCEYVSGNQCRVTQSVCPYMYYCDKIKGFKPSPNMPDDCKVKQQANTPIGYCRVRDERKGWLYIDYNNITIKVKNPFDHTPLYVRVRKMKSGEYKLRE